MSVGIMQKQVIAAGAFIFDPENRLFLGKFAQKFSQQWSIPGGKIDFGEDPETAVKREAWEETGLVIEAPEFLECGSFVSNGIHVVYIDYMAECPANPTIHINDEFSEWAFFRLDDLPPTIIPKTLETAQRAFRIRSRRAIIAELSRYNLGLIRKTVTLHESQPNWAQAADWIKGQLSSVLDADVYTLHHIGSTAVPGLLAKPVIDLLIEFSDHTLCEKDISRLEQMGFTYKGDAIARLDASEPDPDRHFFSFYDPSESVDYIHLHAMPRGHHHAEHLKIFRDTLRARPDLAEEYASAKRQLKTDGFNRSAYTLRKSHLVQKVVG